MAKVMKNCQLEAQYHYQKKLSAAKEKDSPLALLKRKSYNLLMEDTYQSEAEITVEQAYQQAQQNLAEKEDLFNLKIQYLTL
jgi:hypothetical protein